MTDTADNARTLLLRIFASWRDDNIPGCPADRAFEIFGSELVLRPYGLNLEEVEAGIVGGGQDGAIDSVYVFFEDSLLNEDSEVVLDDTRPSDFPQGQRLELWLVQTKRTPSFDETTIDKLENSVRRLLNLDQSLDELSVLYNRSLLARIDLFRRAWNKLLTRRPRVSVNIAYATPGNRRNVTPQVEAKLELLKQTVRQVVPNADDVKAELLGARELLARYDEKPSYTLTMKYQEGTTSEQSHVALVRLIDYFDLITDENGRLRRYLFDWNVRDYQGDVTVNREIRSSLDSTESPEFWWLNNGVTVVCSRATSAGKVYSLSDIQIVNGLQTSHTIYDVLREDRAAHCAKRMLLVRIIVTDDPETRDQIIRATNRQTPVTDASLRATDQVQRNIESYYLTNGWYYDRRKNYYKNEGKDPSKIISIPFLGAAVTAMGLSRPDLARGKPSSLLKSNEYYEQVFDPRIHLMIYLWAAKTQRRVDIFLHSEAAGATASQRNNLKFHLSTLLVTRSLGRVARRPQELHELAERDLSPSDEHLTEIFRCLTEWADEYLAGRTATLETASKSQHFTIFLLERAAVSRGGPVA